MSMYRKNYEKVYNKKVKEARRQGWRLQLHKSVPALAGECEVAPRSKKSSSQRLLVFVRIFLWNNLNHLKKIDMKL